MGFSRRIDDAVVIGLEPTEHSIHKLSPEQSSRNIKVSNQPRLGRVPHALVSKTQPSRKKKK